MEKEPESQCSELQSLCFCFGETQCLHTSTHAHTHSGCAADILLSRSNGGRQHFKGRKDNTLKKTPPQLSHPATWLPAHPILLEPWLMAQEEL